MLRSDDAPDLLRAFERRDYLLSDAGQFEQQQTRADAEAAASAAREQARTWRRSLGAGDTVPDEDAYDFDAMAMGEVWPKPDGAGRVPLPPRYWKPGRLTLAGYDIATGRRVLSGKPLEERLLAGEMDEPDEVATIEDVFARATPEDFAELSTVERRALESWAEAHGLMLAQGGTQATQTDITNGTIGPIPRNQVQEVVGRLGSWIQRMAMELDKAGISIPTPLENDPRISLKDITVGDLGKVLEDISYGFWPISGGNAATGGIGTFGAKPDALEILNTAPAVGAAAKAATKGAKAAVAGARKLAPVAEELVRKGAEQIVWRSGGVMGALPRADDIQSFSVGPSRITPKVIAEGRPLYRETNVSGLDDIMRLDDQYDYHRVFVADRPELALGQGQNRGVIVEFRPNALSGAEHRKPMTGDIAGREYVTDVIAPKPVQSITFESAKDVKKLRGLTARKLASFTREDLPDGKVRFTRKPEAGQSGGRMMAAPNGFQVTRTETWPDGTLVEFGPAPFPAIPRRVELPTGRDASKQAEVRLDDLHSSQREITLNGLTKPRDDSHGLPLVVRSNGVLYIQDGHHRLASEKFAGKETAKVRLIDLDNGSEKK